MGLKTNKFFNLEFYTEPVLSGKYDEAYLYLSLGLIIIPVLVKIFFLVKKNRLKVYKKFDSYWFWGAVILGLLGLWIYFARTQGLPIFSTRAFSYVWLIINFLYGVFLFWYHKFKMPEKVEQYYDKKRKAKYLK